MRSSFGMCLAAVCVTVLTGGFAMGQVLPQSPVDPGPTEEGYVPFTPTQVPGKEYSDYTDKNADGTANPGAIVHWTGTGAATNSFDFQKGSGLVRINELPFEVDALANIRDMYTLDVVADRIALLVSFTGSSSIYYSRSSCYHGPTRTSVWALPGMINSTPGALADLDALEVYGPEEADDACMFSRQDDLGAADGVSIYRYHPEADASLPYLLTSVLRNAVVNDSNEHINWSQHDPAAFDVDALMVWDNGDDDVFDESTIINRFGNPEVRKDVIIFSVRAISGLFDGGEIWTYQYGDDKAQFLRNGRVGGEQITWNTAFNVKQYFGVNSEDIDALEALPEPATVGLLALGGGAVLLRRRRR
jgi:hypothetical protein